jgi:fatty-acid desaturase
MQTKGSNGAIRRKIFSKRGDWVVLGWIAFMHIGALAAFWTFSWQALGVCLLLWFVTGCVGITLGYHRYFTHRSFSTPKPVQYLMAVCGAMAGEAGPIAWVAAHRYHHTYSDTENDPHSPLRGFLWAHVTWLFAREEFLGFSCGWTGGTSFRRSRWPGSFMRSGAGLSSCGAFLCVR